MDSQNNLNITVEYCLYARKSSEDDERQAMSIDSQIKEMSSIAVRDGFFVKEIRRESHSAKMSGQRPVFSQLLKDITNGMFTGILTWAPDRLSRNAGDLGILVDLMDAGKLKQIKTFSQSFSNNPNEKFLLMILCSQAKLENDNRAINVKRGIRAKCEMGWRPGVAPLGYMNRTFAGVRDIIIDPERAPIVREAFDRAAYMYHSGRMVKEWMDKQGFTTRKGKKITTSMVYMMLKNPFYCGYFEYPRGKYYKGKHEPIITKEVFDATQKEISVPRKIKWGVKGFAFKNMFKCYSCGSSVTGEEKLRQLKNGGHHRHVYYHCTRFNDRKCKEPYIEEKELIKLIINVIDKTDEKNIHIPEKLKGAMMEYQRLVKDTIFLNSDKLIDDIEIGVKDYAKYILKEGTNNAKSDLIKQLPIPKLLHNKSLV